MHPPLTQHVGQNLLDSLAEYPGDVGDEKNPRSLARRALKAMPGELTAK